MNRITWIGGTILTLAAIAWLADSAEAAKGVKKNATHKHHGVVVSVNHAKGTMVVKTHHHKKKTAGQPAQANAKAKSHDVTFHISAKTHVSIEGGKGKGKGKQGQANISAIHAGQHVVVVASHHQALEVHIHAAMKTPPKKKA